MDRRNFLGSVAAGGLGLFAMRSARADGSSTPVLFPVPTNTGIKGNVVVVGGGMAGAAVAKYLRLWGGSGVNVTLIEASPKYTSNIMSNTVLTGQRQLSSLEYAYATLSGHYGVSVVKATVASIDANGRWVHLQGGGSVGYDRLVLAPGLEFDLMPGMSSLQEYETLVPHAWRAGPQTQRLRDLLVAMPAGRNVVMTIPKAPYRCPPGPYERACVVADWLKRNKPGSKIIVLDSNPGIIVEKDNFTNAFNGTYAGIVDYQPDSTVTQVSSAALTVTYKDIVGKETTLAAGVVNPIPPQRAPQLLNAAGLLSSDPDRPFAPVDVLSYESTVPDKPGIHVIGDASLTTQPKAGHIGNQQAKTCADAILRLLAGKQPNPSPVTNSACYTPITSTTATWLSAVYQYDAATKTMMIPLQHNKGGAIAAPAPTADNYEDMLTWFATLMGDTFS